MISLNEVADTINRLEAIKYDSMGSDGKSGILSYLVDRGFGIRAHLSNDLFFSEFIEYEAKLMSDNEYFIMTAYIRGVAFFTMLKVDELVDLSDTMPEHFEYISRQLQADPV